MNDRQKLMWRISMAGFAIDDVKLFLDTHPCDKAALEFYEKFRDTKKQLEKEYTAQYGPLRADAVPVSDRWTWADNPWPWEWEA